jgi:benzil reductase ((S)-benzoin forming)
LEEEEKQSDIRVYSVAPGVVDSKMQEKIRSAAPVDFSSLSNFKTLYENNELLQPYLVVSKLVKLLTKEDKTHVIYTLKDLE